MKVVIGVDLGTQGVRVLAVNPQGQLISSVKEKFPKVSTQRQAGLHEQDPSTWWVYTSMCLRKIMQSLPNKAQIDGICIDSTSGSLVVVDHMGNPLYPAIMYNDTRSAPYVGEVKRAGKALEKILGYTFNSSFALPKVVWVLRERHELAAKKIRFLSETDFIVGKLSGSFDQSDYSNMLKFGYDLRNLSWPNFIETDLGVRIATLPNVAAPGTQIASVYKAASEETGLPVGTLITAGATDGVAAQIASGAIEIGSWNSALGTTLVIKGITKDLLIDPQQRIYCHRHPEAGWMPGGASNTGADWITEEYNGIDPESLNQKAAGNFPTSVLRYPLLLSGERFPFLCEQARGFVLGKPANDIERYAAGLEGVAFLEKLAYDTLLEIGAPVSDTIHVTEGGSRSALWSEIRASVLNKTLLRPKIGQAGIGAAILAARGVWFNSLAEAAKAMVQIDVEFHPNPDWIEPYEQKYRKFVAELMRRGYL